MEIKILKNVFVRHNQIEPGRQSIWLLHGFADSGLAYREVFSSDLNQTFNLYVVDLPGFGVSPLSEATASMKSQAELLAGIIREEVADQKAVNIVAHSLGALIGTWLSQELHAQMNCFISVEGNLTEADSYFSSKPLQYDTADEFVAAFEQEIFEWAKTESRFRRYYSSLRFADPEGMRTWSLSSQEFIRRNRCGKEFQALPCRKVYVWGDVDTPKETQSFIRENDIPNMHYEGVGHWHMLENALQFYADLGQIIHRTGRFEAMAF